MAGEFRYPLTRYCLRSGTMTLPQAMVGLFPSGSATAVDTKTGAEHELDFMPPRTVTGLGELFREHRLAVNDELHVRALGEGRFAITAVSRPRAPDYATEGGLALLLDDLAAAGPRMTIQEIRSVYEVPAEVDLETALGEDGRFALQEGRWVGAESVLDTVEAEVAESEEASLQLEHEEDEELEGELVPAAASRPVQTQVAQATPPAPEAEPAHARFLAGPVPTEAGMHGSHAGHVGQSQGAAPAQPASWQSGALQVDGAAASGDPVGASGERQVGQAEPARHVLERRSPGTAPARPSEAYDEDEDGLEATELVARLRRFVSPLGYAIEPLARGQVSLVASMGRRGYKVLVQLQSRQGRIDWADLLSKRRSLGFRHVAVVGDHHALLKLTGPADLARATLWSWTGLERMATLHASVPLSPVDLEPHFERDGLFEEGLARFESTVAERVAERGALSEVLTRLNLMRAPTVFLLEDLVADLSLPRDRVLAILDRLSVAPFHLLARVDHGEFVLRQPVGGALASLSDYALSLREWLPSRQPERLTGHGEPLLLAGDDLEEVDDLDALEDARPTRGGITA